MSLGRRAYNVLRGYINREWDRIHEVERDTGYEELYRQQKPASSPPPANALPPLDRKEHARRLLGVSPTAAFDEIRKAFERLNKRSDPSNFPPGSPEAAQAAEIQEKVNWAYGVLTEGMDPTERRFRSLEID